MWPWFLSPMMHVWGQKKWHKKSLWSWVGRKENNYLQLGHPMDPTSTEAKCFTHSNRATQQTGNSEYKRTKQKSRRLELTNRWQQTSKQTDKRKTQSPTPENDKSVQLTPFLLTYRFLETDRCETTFVTDMLLMERTLKWPSSDNSPQDNCDKCSQIVISTLSADTRWHSIIHLCQKKENAGWSF